LCGPPKTGGSLLVANHGDNSGAVAKKGRENVLCLNTEDEFHTTCVVLLAAGPIIILLSFFTKQIVRDTTKIK